MLLASAHAAPGGLSDLAGVVSVGRHNSAMRALLLLLALLAAAAEEPCRTNQGQACSELERRRPLLALGIDRDVPLLDAETNSTDLAPRTRFRPEFARHGGWRFTTPALAVHRGALWVLLRCYSDELWFARPGTHLNRTRAPCPAGSLYTAVDCPPIEIINYEFVCMGRLDGRLRAVGELRALAQPLQYAAALAFERSGKTIDGLELGMEDARTFVWDGAVHMAVNVLWLGDGHSQGRRMCVQRLFPPTSDLVCLPPPPNHFQIQEKNWAAIGEVHNASAGRTDFLFARFVEPHQILQCTRDGQCEERASTSGKSFFDVLKQRFGYGGFHLGTNAVRIAGDRFLAVLHGTKFEYNDGRVPAYGDHFYVFEAVYPWRIVQVSAKPMQLPRPPGFRFRFTSGLTFVDGQLLLTYGVNDHESWFHITSVAEALSDMEDVPYASAS